MFLLTIDFFQVGYIVTPPSYVSVRCVGMNADLSMNILCEGDNSPVHRGFFTNSTGDLLPALGFLGGLHNFCNFVIIFSLM